jgi:phospholipid-translocating ATPase
MPRPAQTFNLIYTGFPIILLALFDQDVSASMSMRFPVLYKDGPAGRRLNNLLFWGWVLSAVAESLITFFGCTFAVEYVTSLRWPGGRAWPTGWGWLVTDPCNAAAAAASAV